MDNEAIQQPNQHLKSGQIPTFFLFGAHRTARGILVGSPTWDQTHAPSVQVWSPNHWTTWEIPKPYFQNSSSFYYSTLFHWGKD